MSKKNTKTIVLLDTHAILHRAYHALPDFVSSKGEPTGALYGLCTFLLKLIKDLKPNYIVACYDLPEPTLRHEAYDGYKAHRKKIDDALIAQLESSKKVCEAFNIPIYSSAGFEADDMLGTIVEQTKDKKDVDIIIASGDMDTMQLIDDDKVRVYTLKKGIKDTIIYNEKAVLERFGFGPELLPDFKGLRGDPSDNIIGIKGVGEKTAESLIKNFGNLENIFLNLKKKSDGDLKKIGITEKMKEKLLSGEDEALFSKTLATIRRDAPVNFSIPELKWMESVDQGSVLKLLSELDFRSLKDKISETFNFKLEKNEINFTDKDLKEAKLLYWVIDSNKSSAGPDEILSFTKKETLSEAKEVLLGLIKSQGLDFVWQNIEKPLMLVVDDMNKNGIKIDTDVLLNLSKKYHKKIEELEKEIWSFAGSSFNIASPKQLGEVLFEKMNLAVKGQKKNKSGGFSTKESELLKFKDIHPIISLILEYRELSKLLGTYIDVLPTLVGQDSRLHTTFIQAGTTTGRMSSEDPNIQNIPNKTEIGREIRKAFVSKEGSLLVSFDYSQIELRIAAFLSGDRRLIEIFKKGEDIHSAVASEMFKVPISEVTKTMRSGAKTINFGVMYGMGVLALKQNLKVSREEAQEFLDKYFNNFSGLAQYLEDVKKETLQRGYTETFFGRRRYFPEIRSKLPFLKAQAERMAINAPIQGTEADIIKLAMVRIDQYLKEENFSDQVSLLMQVHDELVYEVKEDLIEKVSLEIKKIMESIVDPKEIKGVICKTNVSVGLNWAEMKEIG
jgi:DNA polymerase-1